MVSYHFTWRTMHTFACNIFAVTKMHSPIVAFFPHLFELYACCAVCNILTHALTLQVQIRNSFIPSIYARALGCIVVITIFVQDLFLELHFFADNAPCTVTSIDRKTHIFQLTWSFFAVVMCCAYSICCCYCWFRFVHSLSIFIFCYCIRVRIAQNYVHI